MTTCPMCDDISVVCISKAPYEYRYHVRCECGWAWANSSFYLTEKEAKQNWEKQMAYREKLAKREPLI